MHLQPYPNDPSLLVVTVDESVNDDSAEYQVAEMEDMIRASGLRKVVVDCSGVSFLSSYGLSMLLRLRNTVDAVGGQVKISGMSDSLRGVLRLSKMDSLFLHYPDVEQARFGFALRR